MRTIRRISLQNATFLGRHRSRVKDPFSNRHLLIKPAKKSVRSPEMNLECKKCSFETLPTVYKKSTINAQKQHSLKIRIKIKMS